jgi:membrane protease YdiL (CAAX protease family)
MNTPRETAKPPGVDKASWAFPIIVGGIFFMIAAAFTIGYFLKTPPLERFHLNNADAGAGIVATAPLVVLLLWFMRVKGGPLAKFRESQIEFLADIGFEFTPVRIAIMAIGAGISEEFLFRGVFLEWAGSYLPLWAALLITNVVFGLLHARTALYAVIAGLVGVYLGVLYVASDNLLAPIIAHPLYDAVALELARRAIAARQPRMAEKSGSSVTG